MEVGAVRTPNAALVEIAQRGKITGFVCTAAHVEVVLLLRSPRPYHLVVPVGAFVTFAACAPFLQLFAAECGLLATVHQVFVGKFGKLGSVTELGIDGWTLPTKGRIKFYLCGLRASTLRGNQDNAIGSTNTIHCCRGIFQDGNAFNFVRIDLVETAWNAIYHYQRCAIATYVDVAAILTRLSRTLNNAQASQLSTDRVGEVGHWRTGNVFTCYRCDRTCYVYFLLTAVAHHNHIV